MSKSVSKCIRVKAYSPGPKLLKHYNVQKSWIVPCEYCGRIHLHGIGEGTRSAHCPPKNDYHGFEFEGRERPEQYTLVYAGVLDDPKLFVEAGKTFARKAREHAKAENKRRKEQSTRRWRELKAALDPNAPRATPPSIL
jgi:hypothetical protein